MPKKGQTKTLAQYVQQYGEFAGLEKYNNHQYKLAIKHVGPYTENDILLKDAVRCYECGKIYGKLDNLHFKYTCSGLLSSVHEYKQKYPGLPVICDNKKIACKITKLNLIKKYGLILGEQKWEEYKQKQAQSNTLEYKIKKHGWSLEQFKDFNKSRAVTLQNCIKKYGENEGLQVWTSYLEKQKYTCSLAYFIETWGDLEGNLRFSNWKNKLHKNDGLRVSKKENAVWTILDTYILNAKRSIGLIANRRLLFDYVSLEDKKIIEFNGTFWHMDPRFYEKDSVNQKTGETAQTFWNSDQEKIKLTNKLGYNTYVLWEHDWDQTPEKVIEDILKWWKK